MTSSTPDRLPAVHVVDQNGTGHQLSALLTAPRTALFFLRAPSCPVCLGHARKLLAAQQELGISVVLVTPGGAADAAAVRKRTRAGDAVAVVASGEAHELLGMPKRMMLQHSGTILADADGRVLYSRTAAVPTGSYDHAELVEAVRAAKRRAA